MAARRPSRLIALIGLLLRSPTLDVALSDSASGRRLRDYFEERALGVIPQNRMCRGVLILPSHYSTYTRGRHRQAVRTNARRADLAGIRCETIDSPSEALRATWDVTYRRRATITEEDLVNLAGEWPDLFGQPETTLMVARDQTGPLAVAAVLIDDAVCLIRLAVASSHEARWALHNYLVQTLIDRGVKCLMTDGDGPFGVLGYPHEIQYYQRLLGYELCHISPRDARRESAMQSMDRPVVLTRRRWGVRGLARYELITQANKRVDG